MTTEVIGHDEGSPLPEHARIGPYRLIQPLGEGGMGVVHLALDRNGRAVAVKVLRPHIAHDPVARARLAREVETLSRITDPGVAPFLDADVDGERPYLVTRYVPGPPLDEVVGRDGPLAGPDLRRLGHGLAQSLEAIHAVGVIHRDLKPANVLLLDGEPVLIDFGIAHVAHDIRLTSAGLVMGTPGYLSPEVVEGEEVTPATDWWGWAAVVAFASSGRPPFGRGPMDVVLSRVTRGEADLTGVDPRLAPLLAAALTPDPQARPAVGEVLAALDGYAVGRSTTEVLSRGDGRGVTARLPVAATQPAPAPQQAPAPQPAPVPRPAPAPEPRPYAVPAPLPQRSEEVGPTTGEVPERRDTTFHRGVEHADPRIGRPNRSAVLVALLAVIVAAAAVVPVAAGVALLLVVIVARTADRSVTSLVLRRHAAGTRRSDVPMAVAAGPWHLLVALLASALAALIPIVVGVATTFSTALAIATATGGSAEPGGSVPLAAGALFATWMAWWGPGGASLRRGSRSLVRGVTGGDATRQALVAVLLLAALGLGAWAFVRHGVPAWWPLGQPPGGSTLRLGS